MISKLEAEEERKIPNYKFKTGDRSRNDLSFIGECGSQTEPGAQLACLFLSPFPKGYSCKARGG